MFQVCRLRSSVTTCSGMNNIRHFVARQPLLSIPSQRQVFGSTTKQKCKFSSSSTTSASPGTSMVNKLLEGDTGNMGTKTYHTMTKVLAVITPIYFLTPDYYTNGLIHQLFGCVVSGCLAAHTHVGLNYVCRDYVPKISSKLLGPARIVTAAFSIIMFFGMTKISLFSPSGLKGIVFGLWTPKMEKKAATADIAAEP